MRPSKAVWEDLRALMQNPPVPQPEFATLLTEYTQAISEEILREVRLKAVVPLTESEVTDILISKPYDAD